MNKTINMAARQLKEALELLRSIEDEYDWYINKENIKYFVETALILLSRTNEV